MSAAPPYRRRVAKLSPEKACALLRRPLVTEKATMRSDHNQIFLEVSRSATKPKIKAAVELLFGCKVEAVNTLNQSGKIKHFRGRRGRRSAVKKAMITLAPGTNLDILSGVKLS